MPSWTTGVSASWSEVTSSLPRSSTSQRPAVGEMVDRFRRRASRAASSSPPKSLLDQLARACPTGCWPLGGREALPEEAVVPHLRAVVEQLGRPCSLAGRDHLDQRGALERPCRAIMLVGLVDIGLVMLAVVKIERFGRHVRRQRVLGDRAVREAERPWVTPRGAMDVAMTTSGGARRLRRSAAQMLADGSRRKA